MLMQNKKEHINFLEAELRAEIELFHQKLDTKAIDLLLKQEELYVAQLIKVENGEMILMFSNSRGIPRQGEYLKCLLCPKELRDYRNWGDMTYGDLMKSKTDFSEAICIWQSPSEKEGFALVGFRGLDIDFASELKDAKSIILILGPNNPPYEYIENLKTIVRINNNSSNHLLEKEFYNIENIAIEFPKKSSANIFIQNQLELSDSIIIQGPPGTGKTHLISNLCADICKQGKSVLVTALTNRALIEIAEKEPLKTLLEQGDIFKTKITIDEFALLPNLQSIKQVLPMPGKLILSTFYITSAVAKDYNIPSFDYVIVDEASQALLAMIAGVRLIGKKIIYIGDTKQLPPVVSLSEDIINRRRYNNYVDGFKSITNLGTIPNYQLTTSYRLTQRASDYTSIFYDMNLSSKNDKPIVYENLKEELKSIIHKLGGPTLIKTDLEIGNLRPNNALIISLGLIASLLSTNPKINIAILTFFKETTKSLQRAILQSIGYKKNVLIETVSRVQGLTTDVCIFVIPNASYHRSLEKRLFNVATSRARNHTIIIADENIFNSLSMDQEVRVFLEKLNDERSVTIKNDRIKLIE